MSHPLSTRIAAFGVGALLISAFVLSGCAIKVAPTGGPRDSVPASIVAVEPPSGTTNFTADEIRIAFDDYIDRGIRNSITVLPTKRFTTTYAGDEITISFRESLDSGTTYSITIGTDWTDARGNRPLEAFSYIFSTGSRIDSGSISGRIVASTLQNVIVMCYPRADTLSASFTPINNKAPYIIPVGTSGSFSVKGLSDGLYRVIACRDENKNSMLDMNEDFTTAPFDLKITQGRSESLLLRLGKALDHEPPQVARIRVSTSSLMSVQFTEPVVPVISWDSSIHVVRADGQRFIPAASWISADARDVLLLRFASPLDSAAFTMQLQPRSVRDSAGTLNADSAVIKQISWTTRADTTRLRVLRIVPSDSARDVMPDTVIRVVFSDAVDTNDVRLSIWHQQLQGAIPVTTHWQSPVELLIRATQQRQPKAWYMTTLVPDRIQSIVGSVLSTDTIKLNMLTAMRKAEPGIVNGKLLGMIQPPTNTKSVLRLLNAQGIVVATTPVDSSGAFTFNSVPPGEFAAELFHDLNANGIFDYGDWRPFMLSEPWWPIQNKVIVRSRWTLDDVILTIGR